MSPTKPIPGSIRNLVEDHAAEAYDRLVPHSEGFCGCPICRLDVLVYVLNRVPPRYVVGLEGTVVTDVMLEKDQSRAALDVVMMQALRKVTLAPRCGRARGGK